MVSTDISQLSAECTDWRQILRNYREEFHNCEKALTAMCNQPPSKAHLTQVEHFQNQFDIQLRNIHDLKQTIKAHERRLQLHGTPSEELLTQHEELYDRFSGMEATLLDLRNDFNSFRSQVA